MNYTPLATPRSSLNDADQSKKDAKVSSPFMVYDYALRCAIRAWLEQTDTLVPPTPQPIKRSNSSRKLERTLSASHHYFSISNFFWDESSDKKNKFTREMVKVFSKRLEDIYKARNFEKPEYGELVFQTGCKKIRSMLKEHPYRPTATMKDVLDLFFKTCQESLKNDDNTKSQVDDYLRRYISQFSALVTETIENDAPSFGNPEMMEMLRQFTSCSPVQLKSLSSKSDTLTVNSSVPPVKEVPEELKNFPMVKTLQRLFQIDEAEHHQKLSDLMQICTESAYLYDLKKCINNVHRNQPFPGKRDDFASVNAYDKWQKREIKQLTELLNTLMLLNPNLSLTNDMGSALKKQKSSDSLSSFPNSLGRTKSSESFSSAGTIGSDVQQQIQIQTHEQFQQEKPDDSFTFIPSDPKGCFRFLMSMCVDFDTANFEQIPESERSKTTVLSRQSTDILCECWKTWRLSSSFRTMVYLNLIISKFDQNQVGFEEVDEAMQWLEKVIEENDLNSWTIADHDGLLRILEKSNSSLLHELEGRMHEYWKISPRWVDNILTILDKVYQNPVYQESHPDPTEEFQHLEDTLMATAVERWSFIEHNADDDSKDDLSRLLVMADKLNAELSTLAKRRFPEPLFGILSIPGVVMSRQMPYFALEMDNWTSSSEAKTAPIDTTFDLYRQVLILSQLYDEYGSKEKVSVFKVESWFLLQVNRWLHQTKDATKTWVINAVNQDKFQRLNETVSHSSSVVDLFAMFNQAVDFIAELRWPNELQFCLFETFLSKIIGEGIENYCSTMEENIRHYIFPNEIDGRLDLNQVSYLDKARYQLIGGRGLSKESLVPTDYSPDLCVKLNNFEAVRERLDRLYPVMHGDYVAQYMREHYEHQIQYKPENNNFLYSIKVVRAENLKSMDANGLSDPYVTFEIDGKQIVRTRTIYESLNPRWDQAFDIWLSERIVDVLAVVNDEDVITADEECGTCWFKLGPDYFDDYQTHELKLDLSPQGTLTLRISMEGEKNDIQFWYGKAFRTLKGTEKDVVGWMTDKISPYIRHCLSRQVITRILGREKGFFSSFSWANAPDIQLSIQECEAALTPLLDFLERNLKILNDNLTDANLRFVVLKIWKQILRTIDDLILPPLSEFLSDVRPLDEYELHVLFKWLELLKILFNGGEDGDAIPLENLENPRYFKLLAINAAYHLSTKKLIEYYKSEIATSASTNVVIQADRSKSIYHSEHTVPNSKQPTDGRTHPIDLPDCDAILRILRLRHDRAAIDFLHKEFKRRNEPCNTVFEQKPLYEFPFRDNVSTDSFEEYHLDTPTSPTMRPTSPFSGPRVMRETKIFQTGKN